MARTKQERRGSIMVAVKALDRGSKELVRKAAKLAKARKFNLHAVHVIALPYAAVLRYGDYFEGLVCQGHNEHLMLTQACGRFVGVCAASLCSVVTVGNGRHAGWST